MATAKELLQTMHDVWNSHDLRAWRELANADAQITMPGVALSGPNGMEEMHRTWHEAFPDCSVSIATIIGEGEAAAAGCPPAAPKALPFVSVTCSSSTTSLGQSTGRFWPRSATNSIDGSVTSVFTNC